MRDCKAIWGSILSEIELQVSKANYLTLFKQTHLISIEGNVATVAAPSGMIIDLLQRKFFSIIKDATDKHVGEGTEIVFVPKTVVDVVIEEKDNTLFSDKETRTSIGHLPRVRADYTFENMAVSGSNQLAFVAASSVAKNPGASYNPLFIYGPVGVGKTHLMQAIANEVYSKRPNARILYTTSEEFTNDVVEAIRTNATGRMKKKFRELDLLVIDDIQFIAGKEKVQEELFHTFNTLVDRGAQIVLSSDRQPSEIKQVEKRLISRFGGGLTVDIQSPDFELRCAILLIKAKKYGVALSIDTAKVIAQKALDARGLEGLLLRLVTEAQNRGTMEISEDMAASLISQEPQKQGFRPDEVIEQICSYYKIKPTQLKSAKRDAFLVRPRQLAMYLLKKQMGLTFVEIGNLLGGRDHTTIMHGVEKMEKLVEQQGGVDFMGVNSSLFGKNVD